jgi:hypothetical protein
MFVEPIQSYWKDTSCSTTTVDQKKLTPICQHDRLCPGGWKLFNGRCYLLVLNKTTWADAEKDCYNKGGHLASIHSEDENTFIFNLWSGSGSSLYIGGTDVAVEVGFNISTYIINSRFPQLRTSVKKQIFVFGSLNILFNY